MPSSGYAAISFVANEQPTTAKWNLIGSNDASFNTGAGFNDSIILARHIAANVINSSHIDWTTTTPGGIWWQELTRVKSVALAVDVTTPTFAAKKYLRLLLSIPTAASDFDPSWRFNGDTGANYNLTESNNNGAVVNTNGLAQYYFGVAGTTRKLWGVLDIVNNATEVKWITGKSVSTVSGAGGVGTALVSPNMKDTHGYYNNTSSQITSATFHTITGTAVLPIGTEIVVLGHD